MNQVAGLIVNCPHCNNLYRVPYLIPVSFNAGKLWSDGYNSSRPECKLPGISRCDTCLNYFWVNFNYLPLAHSSLTKNNLPVNLPYTRRLNAYELAEVIGGHTFKNPGTESYLRKLLWWTINDNHRCNGHPEVDTSMISLFEENLESLINKNPRQSPEDLLQLAEIYRELNQLNQAREWLNLVKSPSLEKFVSQMSLKIDEMDSRVFLLGKTVL